MVLDLAYQVIKDIVALGKMAEAEPIDPGTLDAKELTTMGLIDEDDIVACSWTAPRNLFKRTGAPDAPHEIVWVTDKLQRSKRKIVRFTHDGNLDLILIRKKGAHT